MLNTTAAQRAVEASLSSPSMFETGDLVDFHVLRRGHFEAIVLERDDFESWAPSGRALRLLFHDGERYNHIWATEQSCELIEREFLEQGVVEDVLARAAH